MKISSKFSFFLFLIFFLVASISWSTKKKLTIPYSSLNTTSATIRDEGVKLLNGDDVSSKKQNPCTIHYNIYQSNSGPYLDANLKISVDGVEKLYTFWTEIGSIFIGHPYLDYVLDIECPIIDQWEDLGVYQLIVTGRRNTMNGYVYDELANVRKRFDSQLTPNLLAITKSLTINPYTYQDVYISLYASQ